MRNPIAKLTLVITLLLIALGSAAVLALPQQQQDGLPIYGFVGQLEAAPAAPAVTLLITEDGGTFELVGVNAQIDDEITRIRTTQPGASVSVWGTLYDNSTLAKDGQIVVTKIEVVGTSPGGETPSVTVAVSVLNVRAGPNTAYPIVGQVKEGERYDIVGKSSGRRPWWLICCLAGGKAGWVSGDLVIVAGDTSDVPIVLVAPPPAPRPTPMPQPTPTPSGPPVPPPPGLGEWQVTYYNDIHLSGTPLGIRNEPPEKFNLHRNWGLDSPWPGVVPADNWSGRYVSKWNFEGGDNYFELKSNDGARLFVDGRLIIDSWHDGDSWDNDYFRGLSGGTHTVTIEYYERGGLAWLEANWYKVDPGGNQPP